MFENKILTPYIVDTHIWNELQDFIASYDSILVVGGINGYNTVKENLNLTLDNTGISHSYIYYGGECSWSNIDRVKKAAIKYQVIIAVGGGKVLDTAKAAGEMLAIDVITIPTIAATCASTTSLSVIYEDSGSFSQLFYLKQPPVKTFIDLTTLVQSPKRYLKAGMGDTLAKYYEVKSLVEGCSLNYSSTLGANMSSLCKTSIVKFGVSAYESNSNKEITSPFKEVVTTNIITAGLVSCLIDENFNCAVAHAVAMGLTVIEGFEEAVLHGEAVAYGILIQLLLEEDIEEYNKLKDFYRSLDLPVSLNDLSFEDKIKIYKKEVLKNIIQGPNVEVFPFLTEKNLMTTMKL